MATLQPLTGTLLIQVWVDISKISPCIPFQRLGNWCPSEMLVLQGLSSVVMLGESSQMPPDGEEQGAQLSMQLSGIH